MPTSAVQLSRAALQPEQETSPSGFGGRFIENVNIYNPIGEPVEESLQEAGLRTAAMLNLRK